MALSRRALEYIVVVKERVEPVPDALHAGLVSARKGVERNVILEANLTLSQSLHRSINKPNLYTKVNKLM